MRIDPIDQHQIKVTGQGDLAAGKVAHGDDRQAAAGEMAVLALEFTDHDRFEGGQADFGDTCQKLTDPVSGRFAVKQVQCCLKPAAGGPAPTDIEAILIGPGHTQLPG